VPELDDAMLAKLSAPRGPLERARALLAPDRAGTILTEIPLEVQPGAVGAAEGIAFESAEADARIHVFAVAAGGNAAETARRAAEAIDGEGCEVMRGTNGLLAFAGRTAGPEPLGRTAHFRLAQLLSAFSGDE